MKRFPAANPFIGFAEKLEQHRRLSELYRIRLQQLGPRRVAALPWDARSLTTFAADQQTLLLSMIEAGTVEALSLEGQLFVTYRELEGFIGPGYDIVDWLDAAKRATADADHRFALAAMRIC